MTTSVFDPTAIPIETVDPEKDYLSELVGDGKKFTDHAALARGKVESDLFIKRLEAENRAVREELARQAAELKTRTSLDEFLQKVKEANKPDDGVRNEPRNQPDLPALNEEKILELVESRLTAKEKAAVAAQNLRSVSEGLSKVYGNNYVPALEARAQELGLDKDSLDNLAKTAPKAFFALLGVTPEVTKTIFTQPSNSVRSSAGPSGSTKNYKYYQGLRKTLPSEQYYSPAIQNEMFEMRAKLGDDFYS